MIVKTKTKFAKPTSEMVELQDMFNNILHGNKDLITDKIKSITKDIYQITSIIKSMIKSIDKNVNFDNEAKQETIQDLNKMVTQFELDYNMFHDKTEIEEYDKLKDSSSVKYIISTVSEFKKHKKVYDDYEHLKASSGSNWLPFPKVNFNIKHAIHNKKLTEFYLKIIQIFNSKGLSIYNTLITPDLDVDELANILRSYIRTEMKSPQYRNMGELFSLLENSVDKFKNKLPEYYKESVHTGGKINTILELFALDFYQDTIVKTLINNKDQQSSKRKIMRINIQLKTFISGLQEKATKQAAMINNKELSEEMAKLNKITNACKDKMSEQFSKFLKVNKQKGNQEQEWDEETLRKYFSGETQEE